MLNDHNHFSGYHGSFEEGVDFLVLHFNCRGAGFPLIRAHFIYDAAASAETGFPIWVCTTHPVVMVEVDPDPPPPALTS